MSFCRVLCCPGGKGREQAPHISPSDLLFKVSTRSKPQFSLTHYCKFLSHKQGFFADPFGSRIREAASLSAANGSQAGGDRAVSVLLLCCRVHLPVRKNSTAFL